MLSVSRCCRRTFAVHIHFPIFDQKRYFHASISRKQVKPIFLDEFRASLETCMSSNIHEDKIVVAFSGGPDSTCLLYLLKRLSDSNKYEGGKPDDVVAVTIDHGLQEASSQMTEKCMKIAATLRVKHTVRKIPWGVAPFPTVPSGGRSFESLAREARYHLLLSALREEGVSTIAFGHHADDQLETALLRIVRGSTEAGVAGMQARRLWGMGFGRGPDSLGWAGQHGMNRWIIRPLLRFPKERLIATCQTADLEYVVDKTNFQPNVALRNRIRHSLACPSSHEDLSQGTKALLGMAARLTHSSGVQQPHVSRREDGTTSLAQLKAATESISDFVNNVNCEASIQLAKCLRPSPVSTVLLSKDAFSRVTDKSVRIEIIRRVLRFVSPYPWGSPQAEAGRRSASLERISSSLVTPEEPLTGDDVSDVPRKKFVAGGGVAWSPVHITRNTEMKFSGNGNSFCEERGWLASRQSPIRRYGNNAAKSLELDITHAVLSAFSQNRCAEILYDCRFLLHIKLHLFAPDVQSMVKKTVDQGGDISGCEASVKLLVIPHTRYFLPKIILRRTDAQAAVRRDAGDLSSQEQEYLCEEEYEIARLLPDGSTRTLSGIGENNKDGTHPACDHEAVRIKYIRILDADISNGHLHCQST